MSSRPIGTPFHGSASSKSLAFSSRPETEAKALIDVWELVPATSYVSQEIRWVRPPADLAVDALPTLRLELEAAGMSNMELVPCLEIVETVTTDAGTQRIDREFDQDGNQFLWRTDMGSIHPFGFFATICPSTSTMTR